MELDDALHKAKSSNPKTGSSSKGTKRTTREKDADEPGRTAKRKKRGAGNTGSNATEEVRVPQFVSFDDQVKAVQNTKRERKKKVRDS
jgi:hypothetical protein